MSDFKRIPIKIDAATCNQINDYGSVVRESEYFRLLFDETVILCCEFYDVDWSSGAAELTPHPINPTLSLAAFGDNDFDAETAFMFLTEQSAIAPDTDGVNDVGDWHGDTTANPILGQLSFKVNTNTDRFTQAVGNGGSYQRFYFTITGIPEGETAKTVLAYFRFKAENRPSSSAGMPATADPEYYDATQIDALLKAGYELQFSIDGETLWHDTQVTADRYWRYRYLGGVWSDAMAMIVGPQGISTYQSWLNAGNTGTEDDFLNWLKIQGSRHDFTQDDLTNGYLLEIAELKNIVAVADESGTQWQLQQNAVSYTINSTTVNLSHIMDVKGDSSITGTWQLILAGGEKGEKGEKGDPGETVDISGKADKDFSGYAEKIVLVDTDTATLNDSEDSSNIKRLSFLNLWNYIKGKADAVYSAVTHSHAISEITNLQTSLDGKSDTTHNHDDAYSAFGHGHAIADVTDLQTSLDAKQAVTEKGQANGYAELDAAGKVPSAQLPSYVDDTLEYADFASLPATGESGKIYVSLNDNLTYRWSGSAYVEISASLALGETESTAHRGDHGKTAYDHSQLTSGNPHVVTKTDVNLGNVDNTSDADKPVSTAQQAALNNKQDSLGFTPESSANKGQANGYAGLDASGLVPEAQLPSNKVTANQSFTVGTGGKPTMYISSITGDGSTVTATLATGESSTGWNIGDVLVLKGTVNHDGEYTITAVTSTTVSWSSAITDTETGLSNTPIYYKQNESDITALSSFFNGLRMKDGNYKSMSITFEQGYWGISGRILMEYLLNWTSVSISVRDDSTYRQGAKYHRGMIETSDSVCFYIRSCQVPFGSVTIYQMTLKCTPNSFYCGPMYLDKNTFLNFNTHCLSLICSNTSGHCVYARENNISTGLFQYPRVEGGNSGIIGQSFRWASPYTDSSNKPAYGMWATGLVGLSFDGIPSGSTANFKAESSPIYNSAGQNVL